MSCPNLPLLFVIVFWGETNRNILLQMFFKICLHNNFANFIGKHHCWSAFLMKLQMWRSAMLLKRDSITGVFLWIYFSKTPFFTEHLWRLLLNKPRRSLWFIVWQSDTWSFSTNIFYLSNIMLNLLTISPLIFHCCSSWSPQPFYF